MTNKVHTIEKDVEARIEELRERAHEIEEDMEAYAKAAKQYIKKNPIKSTVLAGIAGIVLGKLLSK